MSPTTLRARAALFSAACLAACVSGVSPDEVTPPAPMEMPIRSPEPAVDLSPAPDVLQVALTAAPLSSGLGGEPGYAYNGQIPGPTLRARIGDTLIVELQNDLPSPTTIHWHGLDVPWAMDGVVWMQDPIAPGERFTYTFPLTRAGTFWYHPHFDTEQQVDLGLYGVLVVEDPAEPAVEDVVLVFDDAVEVGRERPPHDHGDDQPSLWLVNGLEPTSLPLPEGVPTRGRLLNASNIGYLALSWPGMRVLAHDQGLSATLDEPDTLVLAPGDRAEVEWLPSGGSMDISVLPYSLHGGEAWGEPQTLFSLEPSGPAPAAPAQWPFAGTAPTPDPGGTDVLYVFTGSEGQWMINGETFPAVTIAELALGSEAILEVRNVSPTEHPFHLHGHSFEVLADGAGPVSARRIEDTVNVRVRESLRLRLFADNPGDWMAHCHLLPHAEQGMMTVLRVTDGDGG